MKTDNTISDPARDIPPAGQPIDREALAKRRAEIAATHLKPAGQRSPSTSRGIHHVALLSSDVERTVKFYDGCSASRWSR